MFQANIPLGEDISLQGCLNAGIVKPTQGDKTVTIRKLFSAILIINIEC